MERNVQFIEIVTDLLGDRMEETKELIFTEQGIYMLATVLHGELAER